MPLKAFCSRLDQTYGDAIAVNDELFVLKPSALARAGS